jgi:hypothetical protein
MTRVVLSLATALAFLASDAALAAAPHAYPAKGQSAAQQDKDERECSAWATSKTGYDPARPPSAPVAKPAPVTGSGSRARGAAAGAIIGGVSGGDAGDAALAGAAIGGVSRRVKNRRAADAQNQANAQQIRASESSFYQARASCLTGRGYSVK